MTERDLVPIVDRRAAPSVPFSSYWETAQTGDIVLVSGAKDLDSPMAHAIKIATRSKFSHIGIVVRITSDTAPWWGKDMYGNIRAEGTEVQIEGDPPIMCAGEWGKGDEVPKDRQVYLLDSDYEEDGTIDGPVLRPFQEVVGNYLGDDYHGTDADIIIRRLECDGTKRAEIEDNIFQFAESVKGACFEAKTMKGPEFVQMLLSVWGGNKEQDLTRLFCSELAAACYQACGLIPDDNATNYQPQHFASEKMNALEGGPSLGEETRIEVEEIEWKLIVAVVSATNVKQMHYFDTPDPYVKCCLAGRERFCTDAVRNNANPEWNCEQEIFWNGSDPLTFKVLDSNHMKLDDFIGTATLEGSIAKGFEGTIPIKDEEEECGQLHVQVKVIQKSAGDFCTSGRQQEPEGKKHKKEKMAKAKKDKRDKDHDKDRKEKKEKREDKKDKKGGYA